MEQKLTPIEQKSLAKSETSIQKVLRSKPETSIEKVLESDSKALSLIGMENTPESALAFIKAFILDLNDFLNMKEKMSTVQMDQTAEIILSTYYYLKIADLRFFFNKIKVGDYGLLYKLDGQVILSFLKKYIEERLSLAEEKSIQEAREGNLDSDKLIEKTAIKIAKRLSKKL